MATATATDRTIVRCRALIAIHTHAAVALRVAHRGRVRAIDRDLRVIRAEAVSMRVRVGEEAALQHAVQ